MLDPTSGESSKACATLADFAVKTGKRRSGFDAQISRLNMISLQTLSADTARENQFLLGANVVLPGPGQCSNRT